MWQEEADELESCQEQLLKFKKSARVISSEILTPAGINGMDVYNPSIPFICDNEKILAGRVEDRNTEQSHVMFFREEEGRLYPLEASPVFELQDPFITYIKGEMIFGGVRVVWEGRRAVTWYTDFYRGDSIHRLRYFTSGPAHMKDIRLTELADGRVAIFSRPQGDRMLRQYGRIAGIGFTTVGSLEEVTPEEKILHYYSMAFAINPDSRETTPVKIICSRDCFPDGPAKQPRLKDVTFTSGIIRNADGTAVLYSGLSDCQIGKAVIPDPLLEYEA